MKYKIVHREPEEVKNDVLLMSSLTIFSVLLILVLSLLFLVIYPTLPESGQNSTVSSISATITPTEESEYLRNSELLKRPFTDSMAQSANGRLFDDNLRPQPQINILIDKVPDFPEAIASPY